MYWIAEEETEHFIFQYSDGKGKFGEGEREKIVLDLADGLPGFRVKESFDCEIDDFFVVDNLIAVIDKKTNQYIGLFGSYFGTNYKVPYLYIYLAFVVEKYQGTTVFLEMIKRHFQSIMKQKKYFELIAFKTFHPTVYRTMQMFAKKGKFMLYPSLNKNNKEHVLAKTAQELMSIVAKNKTMNPETGAILNTTKESVSDLYTERQMCSDKELNEYFNSSLELNEQFLCILQVTREGMEACCELL